MTKWVLASAAIVIGGVVLFLLGGELSALYGTLAVVTFVGMFVVQPIRAFFALKKIRDKVVRGRTGYVAYFGSFSFKVLAPFGNFPVIAYDSIQHVRVRGSLVVFEQAPSQVTVMMPLRLLPNADVNWLRDRVEGVGR
jgi:hypothetical protein